MRFCAIFCIFTFAVFFGSEDSNSESQTSNWIVYESVDPITDRLYKEIQYHSQQGAIFRYSQCPPFATFFNEYIIEWPREDLVSSEMGSGYVNAVYRIGNLEPVFEEVFAVDVEDQSTFVIELNQRSVALGLEGDLDPYSYADAGFMYPYSGYFTSFPMSELLEHDGNQLAVRLETSGRSRTLTAIFDLTGIADAWTQIEGSCGG